MPWHPPLPGHPIPRPVRLAPSLPRPPGPRPTTYINLTDADAAQSRYREFVRQAITRDSEKKRHLVI